MPHTPRVRKPATCVPSADPRASRSPLRPLLWTALALLTWLQVGCPADSSVATSPRPRQGTPVREVPRQSAPMTPETQHFTATVRAITCRMEGKHAASVSDYMKM